MSALGFVIVSLILSAFFSGIEIAFVSANRFQIEVENKKGNIYYKLISFLTRKPSWFIAAMLVGNNLMLVLFGLFMPDLLDPVLGGISQPYFLLILQTLVSTFIILIAAEFVPKTIFSARPMQMLKLFALPAYLFYLIFLPIVTILVGFSNFFIRLISGKKIQDELPAFSMVDLNHYVREHTDKAEESHEVENEIQIFRRALDLSSNKAREFMIPRTEIVALDIEESIEVLRDTFIEHGLTKVLIYRENIDDIIGYVHSFELFSKPKDVKSLLRPIRFIPESMAASEILKLLIRENRSIAVVLDEFGVTAGMLTLEDVVEELFGEIDDEHDTEGLTEKKLDDNTYLFSARLEIDYLNEKYRLRIPDADNYATLSGYIVAKLERIPKEGEVIRIDDYYIELTKVSNTRIEELRLSVEEQ